MEDNLEKVDQVINMKGTVLFGSSSESKHLRTIRERGLSISCWMNPNGKTSTYVSFEIEDSVLDCIPKQRIPYVCPYKKQIDPFGSGCKASIFDNVLNKKPNKNKKKPKKNKKKRHR